MEEVIELLLNEGNGISYILKNLSSKIEEYNEGKETMRLPKSHWGCEAEQVMAGIIVAHSLLQGGPMSPPCCI